MSAPPANELAAFLAAIRSHESGGDYTAYNAAGGASGAYQFINSTWSSWVTKAGYPQYASGPASSAPPAVQDAAAAAMASSYYQGLGGNWKNVAEAWYYPAWAGQPAYQDSVPYPSAGNTLTVGEYGTGVVATMAKILHDPNAALTSTGNNIGGAIGSVAGGPLGSAVGSAIGANTDKVVSAVGSVLNPSSWERILLTVVFVAAGLGLIALGLARMFPGVAHTVTQTVPIPI